MLQAKPRKDYSQYTHEWWKANKQHNNEVAFKKAMIMGLSSNDLHCEERVMHSFQMVASLLKNKKYHWDYNYAPHN